MDIDRCIKTRRSVRRYLKKDIKFDKLTDILDAIRYAPSSGNLQNWRIIVVKDEETKKKIAEASADQLWMADAPVILVICNDKSEIARMYPKHADTFSIQNIAAGIQNMLLKANSLGIDSCWIGSYNDKRIKTLLRIPENISIDAILTLGYAADKEEMPKRIDLENITFFEKWGNRKKD